MLTFMVLEQPSNSDHIFFIFTNYKDLNGVNTASVSGPWYCSCNHWAIVNVIPNIYVFSTMTIQHVMYSHKPQITQPSTCTLDYFYLVLWTATVLEHKQKLLVNSAMMLCFAVLQNIPCQYLDTRGPITASRPMDLSRLPKINMCGTSLESFVAH